jgi:hypothetical protein
MMASAYPFSIAKSDISIAYKSIQINLLTTQIILYLLSRRSTQNVSGVQNQKRHHIQVAATLP